MGDGRFLELIYLFFVDFTFGRFDDIDAPAGEFGGEAGIMAVFADGERELSLGNGDDSGMVGFAQLYLERFDRAERVGHKGGRVRVPLNDVYLLVV